MLKFLGVSRSGYRAFLNRKVSPSKQRKETVKKEIQQIYDDSKQNYLLGRKLKINIIAPPPKNAVEHLNTGWHHQWYDTPGWEERNKVIRHIEEFGLDGWKADVDYHRRSLVENAFYRWKAIFGDHLKSRKNETQYTEQCLRAKIINKFNELGLPKYEMVS